MNIYTADFETNNNIENIDKDYTNVWAYDICEVLSGNYTHITGKSLHEFMLSCLNLGGGIFYFHNLKFDGQFILHYFLRNNYKYSRERKLSQGEFSCLVSDRGVYYNIRACIGVKYKRRVIVEFRDSLKKIVGTVEQIARDYKLPIFKSEIDYTKKHIEPYELSAGEIKYIQNDTEIIARVLHILYENDMTHLTYSSDSLAKYKEILHDNYRRFFPVVDYDIDCFLRESYRGGVVQIGKEHVNKILNTPVYCYDVNSMYPARMCDSILPYGNPQYFEGKPNVNKTYKLYIVKVEVCFDLKNGHVPTLLRKNMGFKKIEYVESTNGELEEFTLNNIDLDLLFEHYNIHEINYLHGYYFRGSSKLFSKYVLPIYEKKCNTFGAEKQLYKLLLNGLSGKFGTNPRHVERIPYLDNYKLCFENGELNIEDPEYTAMASFITAYARKTLFDCIHKHIQHFVYCDTDSVHLLVQVNDIPIDDTKLGYWSLEKIYIKSKYIAQKTYIGVKDNGEYDIKICGAPKSVKKFVNFDNFKIGATFNGKLLPRKVRGGVVLKDTTFTIKER